MTAPLYSASDYLSAIQALMPRGRVWPRDVGTVQAGVLAGLANSYAVQNARANYLLVDAFPQTTSELLPEWEATLGLPSLAAGPAPSVLARQTLVVARFVGAGGTSIACYSRYAGLLGYQPTISGSAPFRCGQSSAGKSLGGVEQMFALNITIPHGASSPFGTYGPAVLQSEFQRIAPPYSVLNFIFL